MKSVVAKRTATKWLRGTKMQGHWGQPVKREIATNMSSMGNVPEEMIVLIFIQKATSVLKPKPELKAKLVPQPPIADGRHKKAKREVGRKAKGKADLHPDNPAAEADLKISRQSTVDFT